MGDQSCQADVNPAIGGEPIASSVPLVGTDDDRADVGFVFVHGIGNHAPGSVLLEYAEPLVAWAGEWNRALGREVTSIDAASITDSDGPAHAKTRVGMGGDREISWLLAEANWADAFPAPAPSDVLGWGARFSGRVIRRVVGHLARPAAVVYMHTLRLFTAIKGSATDASVSQPSTGYLTGAGALQGALMLTAGVILVMLFVWVPLVVYVVALIGVGLLGVAATWLTSIGLLVALKVPGLRSRVAPVALNLATSVGDTYTLQSRPILASAMRDRVVESIQWVELRAKHLIVVGHSQGAELSVTAVLEDPRLAAVNVDALVTMGGAVALLRASSSTPIADWQSTRPTMRWLNLWTAWDPVSAGPLVDNPKDLSERWQQLYLRPPSPAEEVGWPFSDVAKEPDVDGSAEVAEPPEGKDGVPTDAPAPAAGLAGLLKAGGAGIGAAYDAQANAVLSIIPSYDEPEPRVIPGPAEIATHNRASIIHDHSGYATNRVQVVRRLADLAADVGGYSDDWTSDESTAWATKAEGRHVTAVRLLGASRIVAFVLASLLAIRISGSVFASKVFSRTLEVVDLLDLSTASWLKHVPADGPREGLTSIAIGAVSFLVAQGVASALWSWWRSGVKPLNKGGQRSACVLFWVLLVGYTCTIGFLGWDLAVEVDSGDDPVQSALIASGVAAAVLAWSFLGFRPVPVGEVRPEPELEADTEPGGGSATSIEAPGKPG